ncbi:MAG: hypothetical protein ABWZ98_14080 [Nakamurella sp.]
MVDGVGPSGRPTDSRRPTGLLSRAAAFESGIWRSLWRWALRRPIRLRPDASAFPYAAGAAPLIWVFIAISAIEIPILHLLLPNLTLRLIGLGLGAWGVLWMIGLLASMYVHPHVIDRSGVRIRSGLTVDISIPVDAIEEARPYRKTLTKSRTVQYEVTEHDAIAYVAVSSQTNVELLLNRPIEVAIPKVGTELISSVRCFADDPAGMIVGVRAVLPEVNH